MGISGSKIKKKHKKLKHIINIDAVDTGPIIEVINPNIKDSNSESKIIKQITRSINYEFSFDYFNSFADLEKGLRNTGVKKCELIIGIDFTKSNMKQGGMPYFHYENLHTLSSQLNPYQQVLSIMCQSLAGFSENGMINVYGFGDSVTKNKSVFSFMNFGNNDSQYDLPCYLLDGVLEKYNQLIPMIKMSGPSSFVPLIKKTIEIVSIRKEYHILLIIGDGAIDDMGETEQAINNAVQLFSIIYIGVGKGPWDDIIKIKNNMSKKKLNNFHFVDFYRIMQGCKNDPVELAKHALSNIPYQYAYINSKL